MDKVVHFEIPGDDEKRMKKFYSEVFGWKINEMPEMKYAIAQTMELDDNRMPKEPGAINGGLLKRNKIVKVPSLAIDVPDIEAALEKIEEAGGEMIQEKAPVGDMGFVAYFKDTEGNIMSLWETAKK